tara:strand:+ start:310 stop:651 length:342 start_codon:yes stop_codon:yes gene_type:complete
MKEINMNFPSNFLESLLEQSVLFSLKYDLPAGFMRRRLQSESEWRDAYYYEMVKLKQFTTREVSEFCEKNYHTVRLGILRHIKKLAEIGDSNDSINNLPGEHCFTADVPKTLH